MKVQYELGSGDGGIPGGPADKKRRAENESAGIGRNRLRNKECCKDELMGTWRPRSRRGHI